MGSLGSHEGSNPSLSVEYTSTMALTDIKIKAAKPREKAYEMKHTNLLAKRIDPGLNKQEKKQSSRITTENSFKFYDGSSILFHL